jgi:hypothetical protein
MYWDPTGHYNQKQYVAGQGVVDVWVNDPAVIYVDGIAIQGEVSSGRVVASKNELNKKLLGIEDHETYSNWFGRPGTNTVYFEDSKVDVKDYLADLGYDRDSIGNDSKGGVFNLYAGTGKFQPADTEKGKQIFKVASSAKLTNPFMETSNLRPITDTERKEILGKPFQAPEPVRKVMDKVQTGLNYAGLAPVVGEWADGLNAIIYAARGDNANAALSLASVIPFAGLAPAAAKFAIKYADEAFEGSSRFGMRYLNVPYSKVSRGIRNTEILTDAQQAQVYKHIEELGLDPDDFLISSHMSSYSDQWDKAFLGPDMFPAMTRTSRSVLETMTTRATIAHEAGHVITTRAGTAFEAGTLYDEVLASLTARNLPGLNKIEKYQLLRDAAERAKIEGQKLRDIIPELGGK